MTIIPYFEKGRFSEIREKTNSHERGLSIEGPRPDGQQVSWQFGIPHAFDLADVTPRLLRVPRDAAGRHPNGATGITGITVLQ